MSLKGYVPQPAKFWAALLIILTLSAIYTYAINYNNIIDIQDSISDIQDNTDGMQTDINDIKTILSKPQVTIKKPLVATQPYEPSYQPPIVHRREKVQHFHFPNLFQGLSHLFGH